MPEHPIEAVPRTIIRPFPHRYGIGKVLQAKDHVALTVNLDEEENDVGDNRDPATEQREEHADDDEERTNASTQELEDCDFDDFGDIVPEDLGGGETLALAKELDAQFVGEQNKNPPVAPVLVSNVNDIPPSSTGTPVISIATEVPPLVSDMSQDVGGSEPAMEIDEYTSFHGSRVPSRFLPSLERLQSIEGDFWSGAVCLGSGPTNCIVAVLGEAGELLDKCWSSLHMEDLELLVSSVDAARAFKFNVKKMEIIASQAKKILSCEELRKQRNHHMAAIAKIDLEMERRLGGTDVNTTVKSVIGL